MTWRYTNTMNVAWFEDDGVHAIVYKRERGFAYTVRSEYIGGRFLQLSTDNQTFFKDKEEAKLQSLKSLADLRNIMKDGVVSNYRSFENVDKLYSLLGITCV